MTIKEREEAHYQYLLELYKDIPENKKKLVEGLIREAARLKVSLDDLWEDIATNGNTELDAQGREKERPTSAIFTSRDKSYRACIKHLDSLLQSKVSSTGFKKLDEDDDDEDDS